MIAPDLRPSIRLKNMLVAPLETWKGLDETTQIAAEQRQRKLLAEKLRVVVADDHPGALQTLVCLLDVEFLVVAVAQNGQAALECVRRCQPDVVVLDLEMPVLDGIETTKELRKIPSPPAVVVCSVQNDPRIIELALQTGAMGYVLKQRIARDLVKAVRSVGRGEPFLSLTRAVPSAS